jgi:glycosyltransferase involved in cell wall biosynthesis
MISSSQRPTIALVHYSAPSVIGGVEGVMSAHAEVLLKANYPVTVITGRGDQTALPFNTGLVLLPAMDSLFPVVLQLSEALERGEVPPAFDDMASQLADRLSPLLSQYDQVIVHNVFTKHFNLPLTAALHRLLDAGMLRRCIAWCHDFTWSSPSSRHKVHPGYPWDLLRTYRADLTYVTVSQQRQRVLAEVLNCPVEKIRVIYNGVDPATVLGLSPEGRQLIDRLGVLDGDLVLIMPVRITRAKNLEYALKVVAALKARACRVKAIVTGPPDPHEADSLNYFQALRDLRRRLQVEADFRFIFESGPTAAEPYTIDSQVVGDLLRASDVMFMPSHREGFGMPVLEAGLAGQLVACTDVPAATEIGSTNVLRFDLQDDPERTADRLLTWAEQSAIHRLRRRVRQNYTWPAIFRREIEPLLREEAG